jgi:hypothetical protein
MKKKFILAVLSFFVCNTALAGTVSLTQFDVKSQPPTSMSDDKLSNPKLALGLVNDFMDYRIANYPQPVVVDHRPFGSDIEFRPSVVVPAWMRSGVRPSRYVHSYDNVSLGQIAISPGNLVPCDPISYAPRYDLSVQAQKRRQILLPLIHKVACEYSLPTGLFDALIAQESRYNPAARSRVGAIGLAQLMPATASLLGVFNPWDIEANLRGGAKYLSQQLKTFGRYDHALAAYNAGPGNVRKYKGIPRFRETQNYVKVILSSWYNQHQGRVLSLNAADQRPFFNPFVTRAKLQTFATIN